MYNNPDAEPGSIDELFHIAGLIKERMNDPLLSDFQLLQLAVSVRSNDLQREQVEHIESAADSFFGICTQIMTFVASLKEKEEKRPTFKERLEQQKRR